MTGRRINSTHIPLGPDLPAAACKGVGEPLWDTDRLEAETSEQRAQRHARAQRICWDCPELTACLQARLADPTLGSGIYGGQLFGPKQAREAA